MTKTALNGLDHDVNFMIDAEIQRRGGAALSRTTTVAGADSTSR
jgi:hypothetical protein